MSALNKKAVGLGTQTAFKNHINRDYVTSADVIEENINGQQVAEDFLRSIDTAEPNALYLLAVESESRPFLMGLCRCVQKELERRRAC